MKFLRNLVDNGRKLYHEPGSKFHKVWPLFDAMETFLFSPSNTAPKKGPHVRDYIDLKRTMSMVIVALLPCLIWSIYNQGVQHFAAIKGLDGYVDTMPYTAGWLQSILFGADYAPVVASPGLMDIIVFGLDQMLPILFVSYFVGLNIEGLFAVLRKEEISEGYLVSGMLIALIVPASIPLWQLALAVAFSVVICKEVFGGTGMNIFNVALMARAFLFFSYPAQMSGDNVWVAGNDAMNLIKGEPMGLATVDGYSAPTALAAAQKAELVSNGNDGGFVDAAAAMQHSWSDLFFGLVPGSAGETSAFCILLGAALLLITKIASWRTMAGGVIGLFGTVWLINGLAGDMDGMWGLSPMYHLVAGGFLFGIVFMATDPVTCPETNRGKWVYGILIGVLTVTVRVINPAYPEGTMLAILLMNAFAPTIDYFVVQANIRRRRARLG